MATSHLARRISARNSLADVSTTPEVGRRSARKRRARPSPTPHLTLDQYGRLLAVIDDRGGIATLDEISRALPGVLQPISAVFDLCDAEILNADWESAFDGDMHVWRVDR